MPKKIVKGVILTGMIFFLVLPAISQAGKTRIGWRSPEGWNLVMGPYIRLDEAREKVEKTDKKLGKEPAKLYRQILKESGDYWGFGIFTNGKYLEWGPETKIVVEKTTGEIVVSEACFFAESKEQRVLFDCREKRVVVTKSLMPAGSFGGTAVLVKFPSGSLNDKRQVKNVLCQVKKTA